MSCCGENYGCGSSCGRCKMYPDSGVAGAAAETLVLGVAPQKAYAEASETVVDAAENGCKCGANCTCDPCNCK